MKNQSWITQNIEIKSSRAKGLVLFRVSKETRNKTKHNIANCSCNNILTNYFYINQSILYTLTHFGWDWNVLFGKHGESLSKRTSVFNSNYFRCYTIRLTASDYAKKIQALNIVLYINNLYTPSIRPMPGSRCRWYCRDQPESKLSYTILEPIHSWEMV